MSSLPPREMMEDLAEGGVDPFAILEEPTPPSSETGEPENIADAVMRKFRDAYNFRAGLDTEWNVNRAVLAGNQDIYRDARTGELVSVLNTKSRRLWSRNNKVNVVNRALVGKLTRSQISFRIRPGPYDSTSIEGCQFGSRWLEFFSQKEMLLNKYDRACFDIGACGIGYLQLYFDPDAGIEKAACFACGYADMHAQAGATCPLCQQSTLESVREGDVKVRHLDSFSVYWHPGVLKFEESPYALIRYPVPTALAKQKYPQIAQFIQTEPDIYTSNGIRFTYTSSYRWSDNTLRDHVFVYEYLERPTPLYPDGRCIKVINNKTAEITPGYYKKLGRFPIYTFGWAPTPGALYPQPPMADAWHRQRELNENETNSREASELSSKPKALIPLGSMMAVDEMTAATAQTLLVERNLIDKVRYLTPPELSQGHYARRNELIGDIREMFGVTAQEAGAPVDPNGKVLAIQSAESDQTLGPIVRQHNAELGSLALGALVLAQMYTSRDTRMQLLGDDGVIEGSFEQINLEPGLNVLVESDDGFSKNQAVREQNVMNWTQLGLFGMPGTPDFKPWLAAKVARLVVPGLMPDVNSSEYGAANAAIRDLERGIPWQPGPEDDPGIWAASCMDWLRKHGRTMKNKNPQLVDQVRQVMMYYNQALLFAQQQAMAQQAGVPVSNAASQGVSAPGGTPAPNGEMSVVDEAQQVEKSANQDASAAQSAV